MELTQPEMVSIRARRVAGRTPTTGTFQITIDRIQAPPVDSTLQLGGIAIGYLTTHPAVVDSDLTAEFELMMPPGNRYGVLVSSPDFASVLQIRSADGQTITSNSGFNQYIDQCNLVHIDQLPKLSALGETLSYVTVESTAGASFRVVVTPKVAGETGLFSIRIFDLTDPKLNVGDQVRTGTLGLNHPSASFELVTPPSWNTQHESIEVYSDLPVSIILKDKSGAVIGAGIDARGEVAERNGMPFRLSLLYSSSIKLAGQDSSKLVGSTIEIRGKETVEGQMFLVGPGDLWGACGGGAIDPIMIAYPNPKDFADRGYAIESRGLSLTQIEALVYQVARHALGWFFLLQCSEDDSKDPVDFVSSYTRLVPNDRSLTSLLVDFQVALRLRFSKTSGATRIWARVERRGYKQSRWQIDPTESAIAQEKLVAKLRAAWSAAPGQNR